MQRENAELLLVCNDFVDDFAGNRLFASGEAVHQGGIANNIDHTGYPAAGFGDFGASFQREDRPWRRGRAD